MSRTETTSQPDLLGKEHRAPRGHGPPAQRAATCGHDYRLCRRPSGSSSSWSSSSPRSSPSPRWSNRRTSTTRSGGAGCRCGDGADRAPEPAVGSPGRRGRARRGDPPDARGPERPPGPARPGAARRRGRARAARPGPQVDPACARRSASSSRPATSAAPAPGQGAARRRGRGRPPAPRAHLGSLHVRRSRTWPSTRPTSTRRAPSTPASLGWTARSHRVRAASSACTALDRQATHGVRVALAAPGVSSSPGDAHHGPSRRLFACARPRSGGRRGFRSLGGRRGSMEPGHDPRRRDACCSFRRHRTATSLGARLQAPSVRRQANRRRCPARRRRRAAGAPSNHVDSPSLVTWLAMSTASSTPAELEAVEHEAERVRARGRRRPARARGATNRAIWALEPMAMPTARSILSLSATRPPPSARRRCPRWRRRSRRRRTRSGRVRLAASAIEPDEDLRHHADGHAGDAPASRRLRRTVHASVRLLLGLVSSGGLNSARCVFSENRSSRP